MKTSRGAITRIGANMGYRTLSEREQKYQPRKGLEGPFFYPSGAVLYYDPKAGQYWDPQTDFYVSDDDVSRLKNQYFDLLSR
jgi:hypothetical protein